MNGDLAAFDVPFISITAQGSQKAGDSVFRHIQMLTCRDEATATMASQDFLQSSGKYYIIIEPSTCLNLEPTAYAI